MLNNALIARYRFSTFRPGQLIIWATIYLTTVFLMIWMNSLTTEFTQHQIYENLYLQFIVVQIIVLWLIGAWNCGSVVPNELKRNSYVFFRLLPMSGVQKTVGVLIGRNLLVGLTAVVNFALIAYFGLAAGVPRSVVIQVICVLIAGGVLFGTGSLLSSIRTSRKKAGNPTIVLIIFCFFFLPQTIGLMAWNKIHMRVVEVEFYYAEVPVLVISAAIALYLACWAFLGAVRKFTAEDKPLFARPAAVIFALGIEAILIGFFLPCVLGEDSSGDMDYSVMFWSMSMALIWPLAAFALWRYDRYLEESSNLSVRRRHRAVGTLDIVGMSNIKLALITYVIWAGFALMIWQMNTQLPLDGLAHIAVLFSFYIVFVLLLETIALCRADNTRVIFLVGFIAILYVILPILLGVLLEESQIGMLSIFGYLSECFGEVEFRTAGWIPAMVNAAYAMVLAVFVTQRYRTIGRTRAAMQTRKLTENV
ncbi:MAG: hypothetical protein J7M40_03105 [Planctomycetes bacterium]|nr:hypothetical protein [Planctomycetota bacterium]